MRHIYHLNRDGINTKLDIVGSISHYIPFMSSNPFYFLNHLYPIHILVIPSFNGSCSIPILGINIIHHWCHISHLLLQALPDVPLARNQLCVHVSQQLTGGVGTPCTDEGGEVFSTVVGCLLFESNWAGHVGKQKKLSGREMHVD